MNAKFLIVILSIGFNAFFFSVSAQDTANSININKKDSLVAYVDKDTVPHYNKLITVVYDIKVTTSKNKTGIEETYNGGIKTLFVHNDKARIRLVSLMRIQSIFFSTALKPGFSVAVVKESGKKKYKYYLTNSDWDLYNTKYADDSCHFTTDSLTVLNYPCRKVIITLKDGRSLIAYYTSQLKPLDKKIEPAFKGIPGLVLQYEYQYKKNKLVYTANKISEKEIAASIFKIPAGTYKLKKYCYNCHKVTEVSEDTTID